MEFDGKDFDIIESEDDAFINKGLYKEERSYLILSSYFPDESEIGELKKAGNGYKIIRRSGFVNSPYYSEEPQKRKQIYMISSGVKPACSSKNSSPGDMASTRRPSERIILSRAGLALALAE